MHFKLEFSFKNITFHKRFQFFVYPLILRQCSYCYANRNDLILVSFNIKNNKTKATLAHTYVHRTSYK